MEAHIVAAFESPEAGESGTHAKPAALPGLIFLDFFGQRRACLYKEPVSSQNVPELRHFIQAELAQPTADRRAAWIIGHLEDWSFEFVVALEIGAHLVGPDHHGAKLIQPES